MPVGSEEVIDMRIFYERRRPVLLSAFAVTYAMSMVANFADRNNLEGWKPGDWIGADLLVLPMLIAALVASPHLRRDESEDRPLACLGRQSGSLPPTDLDVKF